MIPRNHPQYVDIENFEDHELTICIAYEMAIRSPEVIKIINRNLFSNSYWYAIDMLCRINLLLSQHDIEPIDNLSEFNKIMSNKFINKDCKNALMSIYLSQDYEKYFTLLLRGLDHKYSDWLDLSYKFYTHIEKLRIEIGEITFEDAFIELENIGMEEKVSNLSESAQNIENFYKALTKDEQDTIDVLIALNIHKSDPEMHYDILYNISKEDADILQDKYYLDIFHKDNIYTMNYLHLSYTFINIYDYKFKMRMEESGPVYDFEETSYMTKLVFLKDEPLVILRQRPLLKIAKKVENFVMDLPKKEFMAQIDLIKERYSNLKDLAKKMEFPLPFFPDDEIGEGRIVKDKSKIADMFFLYDNKKNFEIDMKHIKADFDKKTNDIRIKAKRYNLKINDFVPDSMTTLGDYLEYLKEEYNTNLESKARDLDVYMELQLEEYYGLSDISSIGFKRSSRYDKYKRMKSFIDEGEYVKLLSVE